MQREFARQFQAIKLLKLTLRFKQAFYSGEEKLEIKGKEEIAEGEACEQYDIRRTNHLKARVAISVTFVGTVSAFFPFNFVVQDARVKRKTCERNIERKGDIGEREANMREEEWQIWTFLEMF